MKEPRQRGTLEQEAAASASDYSLFEAIEEPRNLEQDGDSTGTACVHLECVPLFFFLLLALGRFHAYGSSASFTVLVDAQE